MKEKSTAFNKYVNSHSLWPRGIVLAILFITLDGRFAQWTSGSETVKVLSSVSSTIKPVQIGIGFDTPDSAAGVQVVGSIAYVADGKEGLKIIQLKAPPILSIQPMANGILQLELNGQSGTIYRVDATSDFKQWSMITSVTGPKATIAISQSQRSGAPIRFYRAVSE